MSEDDTQTLPHVRLAATLAALGFERACPRSGAADAVRVGKNAYRVSVSTASMCTRVSVVAVCPSRDQADEAIGRAIEELHRVVPLLNRHDGSSALTGLNDRGVLRDPPPELVDVLGCALSVHALSRGTFDVTVKPVVDVLRALGPRAEASPDLTDALTLVDMAALHVSPAAVRLGKEGMGLTLDGIAKGYIVDRMASVMERHGVRDWLIDAGGDIRTSGRNECGQAWRVGVQDPDKGGRFPDVLALHDGAVATSGGYENFYAEDQTTHHIVDSTTGHSPTLTRSASVTAPTTMVADALATASLVMLPARALALIEGLPGCSCLLLDAAGRRFESVAWTSSTSTTH